MSRHYPYVFCQGAFNDGRRQGLADAKKKAMPALRAALMILERLHGRVAVHKRLAEAHEINAGDVIQMIKGALLEFGEEMGDNG